MVDLLIYAVGLALVIPASVGLAFFLSSIWEREKRAAALGGIQFALMLGAALAFFYIEKTGFFDTGGGMAVLVAMVLCGLFIFALLFRKTGSNPKALAGTRGSVRGDVKRIDEREIVFSRGRILKPGMTQYDEFYRTHPTWEAADGERRRNAKPPGYIDRPYEGPNKAGVTAQQSMAMNLSTPDRYSPKPAAGFMNSRVNLSPEEATERIKGFARNIGADLVGITEINPFWIYSHRGMIFNENWEDWGRKIELEHKYAVVFATEMSFHLTRTAPHTASAIEVHRNYALGAFISCQLAAFIANLGYSATAEHFRHYDTLMVPLAVDAGLGEMSRMGYLITKPFGPRVRLAAVTTDLPLNTDKPLDLGVEDFCTHCKKCALTCPSGSIPIKDQTVVNGIKRWKLDAETCFEYWGKVGTGCAICMSVCPWSHASTLPHKIVRMMVRRNKVSRRLFTVMDDIFYGKKPKPVEAPGWARFKG
jgi:reductive dehalogenase